MSALPTTRLNDDLSVAPQLEPQAMQLAAQAGFKSVINNRPDFEAGPEQPTSAAIEAAARAAGLEYRYLPVSPMVQTPEEVARFAALLAELPKPILAFCRSGTRCGKVCQAAARGGGAAAERRAPNFPPPRFARHATAAHRKRARRLVLSLEPRLAHRAHAGLPLQCVP